MLEPALPPPRGGGCLKVIVIFVGALVALYLLLVLVGGMGWDGY